jgi:signal transduction protein with GAF and PtsI domain
VPVPEALALPHWLGVPIIAGDDVLGVLTLAAAARPFTDADKRLLGNIASLTALALRSARLYEERSATYRELTRAQDHLVRTEPQACRARFPDVPVGLITGWGDHLDLHGVRFVVAKPFEAAEVLHRVGDALAAVRET